MGRKKVAELRLVDTKDKSVTEVHIGVAEQLEVFAETDFAPAYFSSDSAIGWASGYATALEDFKELLRTGKVEREGI